MDTHEAQALAVQLMNQHGLTDWTFKFDRSSRRFGRCEYAPKVISLSAPLTELNSLTEVRDTILHEIAHALVGVGHHHDWIWQCKARQIGAKGERCYSDAVITPKALYESICAFCKLVHKRNRLTQRTSVSAYCTCHASRTAHPRVYLKWERTDRP